MIDLKEGDQGQCSQAIHHHNMQSYQDQFFLHQQQQMQQQDTGFVNPSEVSPLLPWSLTQVNSFNPAHFGANPGREHHPLFLPPPPPAPPSSSYESLINRPSSRASAVPLQFAYDHHGSSVHLQRDQLRIISDALGPMVVQHGSTAPFGLQAELNKMTAQEIMDAKALAASKSHSEAERRRRERINNHFAKLRSLLPSTTKTDKASLLAEVIQHVKELKRQTSLIAETSPVPTETDELTVDNAADEEGRLVIKASLCCDDRSDLLPDLINTLKALSFRTLKAEITTLGGRVKNVLFITGDDHTDNSNNNQDQSSTCTTFCDQQQQQYCVSSIQEALRAVMEKASGDDCASAGSVKRQRTNLNNL